MTTLADRLKLAMAEKQVRPADLARAAQVKPPSVSDWLSGATKSLKGDNLLRVARVLGVEPSWLAHGVGSSRAPSHLTAREPEAAYDKSPGQWPFKRVNEYDFFEYLDVFQRAEIEGFIAGLINAAKKEQSANGTLG